MRDKITRRNVAVKRVDPTRCSESQRERFLCEARIQARLDHPTVVPVHDVGIDDDGLEYFTMKRVSGLTLEEILEQLADDVPGMRQRFSLNTRLHLFRQVCLGVEYAHEHGIVHRDLKPANVIVGEFGEVHVIDWGIAKILAEEPERTTLRSGTTGRGMSLGTPGYMAPEQIFESDSVDARADVHALGAILFELITLQPLYPGERTDEVLAATQHGAPVDMSERAPGIEVPPELEQLCRRATATRREERLGSVAELREIMSGYLDGDRDLELRRALAARHAKEAARTYQEATARGDIETSARQRVLQEAGRALALDPRSSTAIEVVTGLMSQLPAQAPAEVEAMYIADEERFEVEARRRSLVAYALHLPVLPLLAAFFGVRDWIALTFIFVPLLVAMAVAAVRLSAWKHKPPGFVALGSVLVALAAASSLGGPYLVTPGYIVAYSVLSIVVAKGGFHRPLLWAAMCAAAFLVPVLLELAGVLPANVSFEPSRMIVEMRLLSGSPALLHAGLIAVTLASIMVPMGFAYRMAERQRETRMQLFFQMWHLRNLAPRSMTQG